MITLVGALTLAGTGAGYATPTHAPVAKDPLDQVLRDRKLAVVKLQVSGGDRPAFSWGPVKGASSYLLSVRTKKNVPVWAWSGEQTKVRLGAGLGTTGPRITRPSLVQVFALDDAGRLTGISKVVPIG